MRIRKFLLLAAAGFLLLLILEAGVYNWRLTLSMRYREMVEHHRRLTWQRDELLVERAVLLNPSRLQEAGESLGLAPVPVERTSILHHDHPASEGEHYVCMGQ